jgi:hypothetical protein
LELWTTSDDARDADKDSTLVLFLLYYIGS